jgi:short-subunit dehydrogenase
MKDERSKSALVIGASRGIGASVSTTLASSGYSVFLASKTLAELALLSNNLDNAEPIRCDVRSSTDVKNMINDMNCVPDLLVYNAGAILHGSWTDTSVKKFKLLNEVCTSL